MIMNQMRRSSTRRVHPPIDNRAERVFRCPVTRAVSAQGKGNAMNMVVGPLTVSAVGVVVGTVCHVVWRRFWVASTIGTVAAAALWIGGCYAILALTAPSELEGPLLLAPAVLMTANAFLAVVAAGGVVRFKRAANQRGLRAAAPASGPRVGPLSLRVR